jgi:alpha-tubulin suppressor-like RCC1 family protein
MSGYLRILALQNSLLSVQEKLEDLKYEHPRSSFYSQRKFHTPFIQAARICNIIQSKSHHNSGFYVEQRISSVWISLVEKCVHILYCQLVDAINEEINYFGDRNEDIAEKECLLVLRFFSWLIVQSWDEVDGTVPLDLATYFGNTAYSVACSTDHSIGITDSLTENSIDPVPIIFTSNYSNIPTKLFWLKHFRWCTQVTWLQFKKAFVEEFGLKGQTHALSAFEKVLCVKGRSANLECLPGQIYNDLEQQSVSFFNLHRLVEEFDPSGVYSIFNMYQAICDPQTAVVLMGQLMDHQSVQFRRPTIVRSLLGCKVTYVSCGDQHIAAVVDPGLVYTWGKGVFGRLGHGHEADVHDPQLVSHLHCYESQKIVQVSCGFAFTGFVSEIGRLYMCGAGMNGRLGLGSDENQVYPQFVSGLHHEHVSKVQNGSVHCVILTKGGRVYSCGKADFTGLGQRVDIYTPMQIPALIECHIVDIAVGSGGFHTIALTKDGEAYSWGHNRVGQLGIVADNSMPRNEDGGYYVPIPQRIVSHIPRQITRIAAGWGHSCLLGDQGDVYICGRNVENQLGLGSAGGRYINERGHYYQPHLVHNQEGDLALVRVTQVACGGEHTLFHTSDYEIVGVGLNRAGQLDGTNTGATSASHISNGSSGSSATSDNHENSTDFLPRVLSYFNREKRRVLQMSCGFSCSMVLLGERSPTSLRALCTRRLRSLPTLREQVLQWQQERAQVPQKSTETANNNFEKLTASIAPSKPDNEILTVHGCFLPEALYHDLDLQRSVLLPSTVPSTYELRNEYASVSASVTSATASSVAAGSNEDDYFMEIVLNALV